MEEPKRLLQEKVRLVEGRRNMATANGHETVHGSSEWVAIMGSSGAEERKTVWMKLEGCTRQEWQLGPAHQDSAQLSPT